MGWLGHVASGQRYAILFLKAFEVGFHGGALCPSET